MSSAASKQTSRKYQRALTASRIVIAIEFTTILAPIRQCDCPIQKHGLLEAALVLCARSHAAIAKNAGQ